MAVLIGGGEGKIDPNDSQGIGQGLYLSTDRSATLASVQEATQVSLRDRNPERLNELMHQIDEDWQDLTALERVQETWATFTEVYSLVAYTAWDIEASRGNLVGPDVNAPTLGDVAEATVRDQIASGALGIALALDEMMDKLEAQKELVAAENFGDNESDAGKSSSNLVVLANCLRPISDVIQDAAADLKSSTLNTLDTARHRQPSGNE